MLNPNFIDNHYPECEEQPEDRPCICQKIMEEQEQDLWDAQEAEATGN